MSTQHSSSVPPTAAEHLNLAERFSSFAEYAASTASLPQTAATSLDVARFHAFTGELTLSVAPPVRLYLDGGSVYYAERDGDRSVSRVLLDAGVIDSVQLQRGVVSVGDVAHLGRLFDRDTTVDRDAVMVVVEGAAEALVQQIANSVIAAVTVSAYRHHPSGIHRWFVAPIEPTGAQRPASGVTQVDRSVVEELPRLGADPTAGRLTIEWAEPDPANPGASGSSGDDSLHERAVTLNVDIQAELDRFDADRADWAATSGGHDPDASEAVSSPLGEFRIVWPNGAQDSSMIADAASAADDPEPTVERTSAFDPPVGAAAAPMPTVPATPFDAPAPGVVASDPVGLTIEPLQIDRLPEPDAAVPDDVATAVRRALQAIETASSRPASPSVPELHLTPVALPKLTRPNVTEPAASAPAPSVETLPAPPPPPRESTAGAPLGFAPPTMDMRAEAVYQRAAAASSADLSLAEKIARATEPSRSEPGTASPDFVSVADNDAAQERRGALRRLIGSLRNKD